MKIGEQSLSNIISQAALNKGLCFNLGPFAVRLRTSNKNFLKVFQSLYFDFPLLPHDAFVDCYIDVFSPPFRRWIRPQISIRLDGEQPFPPSKISHAMPMFEWGLNWGIVHHGHHFLMLHAAVVEKQGKALLLPALPGSGKSTLCAALAQRGWRFLSDEFGLIRPSDGRMIAMPRPTPLKNESINIISEYAPHAFIGPLFTKTRKGTIGHLRAPAESVQRFEEPAIPAWIVFPRYQAESPLIFEPLAKSFAFLKLASNAFNYEVKGEIGFQLIRNIINNCNSYKLTYSNLDEAVARLGQLADGYD